MIRELLLAMLFSEASRLATREVDLPCDTYWYACQTAARIYGKEWGFAGMCMYRPVQLAAFQAAREREKAYDLRHLEYVRPGLTMRCTCPPPKKVSDWHGRVGHVVRRDADCPIHREGA